MPHASTKSTGFTPIPLLIAVVIAGVFATVAIPKITQTQSRKRANAMKIDLLKLLAAEQAYYADSARYAEASTLVQLNRFSSSSGVARPTVRVGAHEWSATVTLRKRPREMCGISVNTRNPVSKTALHGEPVCRVQ